MQKVEIRPAYEWTCNECGIDQFERAVISEKNQQQEEIKEIIIPQEVQCKNCGAVFETLDNFEENGEENE